MNGLQQLIRAFVTVFPAELPDKTMIATVVLVARYRRPLWVWVGAVSAFTVHVTVAAVAGGLIGLLPQKLVDSVVAGLFTVGAVLLFRAARQAGDDPDGTTEAVAATPGATVIGSFGLIVVAEWGDLTQLATVGLAASGGAPVATAIGALAALASVSALAATFGRQLVARVPIQRINYLAALVFAALALWTVLDIIRPT